MLIASVLLSKHSFIYANIATQFITSKVHLKSYTINKFNKIKINYKVIKLYI